MKSTDPKSYSPFKRELLSNTRYTIGCMRREGTTAVSFKTLWAAVTPPSAALEGAPKGTLAAWSYENMLQALVDEQADIKAFILVPEVGRDAAGIRYDDPRAAL